MTKKTSAEVKAQLKLTTWLIAQNDIRSAVMKAHRMLVDWQFASIDTVKKEAPDPSGDIMFETFWKAYPRKVGKQAAFRSWKKIRPSRELAARICKSVKLHSESEAWMREKGRFVPNPATFLNQGRYDDEIEAKTPEAPRKPMPKLVYDPGTRSMRAIYQDQTNV